MAATGSAIWAKSASGPLPADLSASAPMPADDTTTPATSSTAINARDARGRGGRALGGSSDTVRRVRAVGNPSVAR